MSKLFIGRELADTPNHTVSDAVDIAFFVAFRPYYSGISDALDQFGVGKSTKPDETKEDKVTSIFHEYVSAVNLDTSPHGLLSSDITVGFIVRNQISELVDELRRDVYQGNDNFDSIYTQIETLRTGDKDYEFVADEPMSVTLFLSLMESIESMALVENPELVILHSSYKPLFEKSGRFLRKGSELILNFPFPMLMQFRADAPVDKAYFTAEKWCDIFPMTNQSFHLRYTSRSYTTLIGEITGSYTFQINPTKNHFLVSGLT